VVSQVCKLLATSCLSFVNIYFQRQVKYCASCEASWLVRQVNRGELFYFWSYLPSPTTPTYQAQATCLLLGTCKHTLTSVCVSCGQFIILCRSSLCALFCCFLYHFKMPARWKDETTCKFVQLYRENECLRNTHTSNISAIRHILITRFARSLSIVLVQHEIGDWTCAKHLPTCKRHCLAACHWKIEGN
jgi:hypothetical protein